MRTRILALLAATMVFLSACEPARNDQMFELDGLVFQLSYDGFKWYTGNSAANGVAWYPYMNWSTDECSAPLIGNGIWDFKNPCKRHDFSWRNLHRISDTFDPNVWNGRNKNAADLQFRDDLYSRCHDFGWYQVFFCFPDAEIYFAVVNLIPPYASPGNAFTQGFDW